MSLTRKIAALLLATSAGVAAAAYARGAQTLAPFHPQAKVPHVAQVNSLVLLDPAHGGPDDGANLGNNLLEKDVTLGFAVKLRPALAQANFNVITTRDAGLADPLSPDQRAGLANRQHPLACLVLHATAAGVGVHLYTSPLPAGPEGTEASDSLLPIPWDSAQSAFVGQSHQLAAAFSKALEAEGIPVISGNAAVAPLDNLMCPAVAIEIAPLHDSPIDNADYQHSIVTALVSAMRSWQSQLPAAPATRLTQRSTP